MEARPLHMLYSKYNLSDSIGPVSSVRPLGKVRREKKTQSSVSNCSTQALKVSNEKLLSDSKTRMDKHDAESSSANSNSHGVFSSMSGTGPATHFRRSKSQMFEHKYRIAAARSSAPDQKVPTKGYTKKVIHLPMFRIDVKTYLGDSEISKTVESTRESLRTILAENQIPSVRPMNLVTANITNFEFKAPRTPMQNISAFSGNNSFPSKSANAISRRLKENRASSLLLNSKTKTKLFESNNKDNRNSIIQKDDKYKRSVNDGLNGDIQVNSANEEIVTEREIDCPVSSMDIKPDTQLTLASTMRHLDRVAGSSSSLDVIAISDVSRGHADHARPAWPSFEDYQKLKVQSKSARAVSRGSILRPQTSLSDLQDTYHMCHNQGKHHQSEKRRPVLRYTSSKQNTFKLDPIIVPSHTCTECLLCNIYQRDLDETPCPPNSPTPDRLPSDIFMEPLNQANISARTYKTGNLTDRSYKSGYLNDPSYKTKDTEESSANLREEIDFSKVTMGGDLCRCFPDEETKITYIHVK
ncbi:hypothetical protein ACJMK2_034259 [Sinanodonta woodiana]|uniref:Uncharacterized protein n=1 Tax=Sinanodonta woodiana TaxID=1069815 RepID=A0ABD3WQZ8_SINWO